MVGLRQTPSRRTKWGCSMLAMIRASWMRQNNTQACGWKRVDDGWWFLKHSVGLSGRQQNLHFIYMGSLMVLRKCLTSILFQTQEALFLLRTKSCTGNPWNQIMTYLYSILSPTELRKNLNRFFFFLPFLNVKFICITYCKPLIILYQKLIYWTTSNALT